MPAKPPAISNPRHQSSSKNVAIDMGDGTIASGINPRNLYVDYASNHMPLKPTHADLRKNSEIFNAKILNPARTPDSCVIVTNHSNLQTNICRRCPIFTPKDFIRLKQKRRIIVKLYVFLIAGALVMFTVFSNCKAQQPAKGSSQHYSTRRMILRDEGLSQLSYVDLTNPGANWHVPVPAGRDIQLVGDGRVLLGTGNGYEEHDIITGKKVDELNSFPGTIAARRLRNGNTLLVGVNWQGKQGIVLVEVDKAGKVKQTIAYPGFDYARLVRQTATGNFLVTADETVFEGNARGEIVWRATVTGLPKPHAWQALRLRNGQTLVSGGYSRNFQLFSREGKLLDSISGPADVNPHFFAGYQVLANGNYVVTNWQGHGPKFGASGVQVLEYTPKGKLAWSWKQDATKFSSLQGIIVLDGLDLKRLYVEDAGGVLVPVGSRR